MADDDARAYVLAFESNKLEAGRVAAQTASKLENGSYKLVDAIKATGEYLQNTDPKVRERATHYLAAIITALPPKFLSRQDIAVLNTFLCSRIRDAGAVDGLTRLQSLARYTKENAQELAQAVFDDFADMTGKKQAERYQVYILLNELLSNHRTAMLEMGDKSLLGYAKVVAGEQDPRNLMLIFSMLRVIMVEWDISAHTTLMFDSVFAYFPITFRPPPNDPYGITAQDLKNRLRECLASNSDLALAVFPALLEKLDSTLVAVKKDVLQALAACAFQYDPATLAPSSLMLWDAVKYEVLQAQEPFLADEALSVIKNIAIRLTRNTTTQAPERSADPLIQYLRPVNQECLEHLEEPASRQAGASADILKAVASASIRSFEIVLRAIGPTLFTLQQTSEGMNNQRAVLTVVNKLFEASIEVYGSSDAVSEKNSQGEENLLIEFKDRLLAIYSRALMSTVKEEVSYRLAAAKGLLLLAQMRSFLDDNETGLIVQHFNDIVLDEESYGRDELKQRTVHALTEISRFKPRMITDIAFPRFIARLPENEKDATSSTDYQSVLEGLAEISVGQDLLETLIRRLLNKLDILIETGWQSEYPYTCAILSTILYVLQRSTTNSALSLDVHFGRVVVGLSEKVASGTSPPLGNEVVLTLLGKVMNLVVRHSSNTHKDETAQNIYRLFRHTHPDLLDSTNVDRYYPQTALILSTWLLAALPKSLRSGVLSQPLIPLIQVLAYKASQMSSEEDCIAIERSCFKQIAVLVNKYLSNTEDLTQIATFFQHTANSLKEVDSSPSPDEELLFQSQIRYIFTLAKALVLRLAPSTNIMLTKLVDLLAELSAPRARYCAIGFNLILAPDEILSKKNEAQIRLLAPQRIFQILVPMFSDRFKDQNTTLERKEIYLIALSGILGTVSSEIVMPELPTLLPLLLQSLEIPDTHHNVKIATLETMVVVITKNPDALIESGHIPALIRRLINTAALLKQRQRNSKTNSSSSKLFKVSDTVMLDTVNADSPREPPSAPKSRQLALHCLTLLPQYIKDQKTPNPLLALKKEVLHGLTLCLDDPKRDVRKEAVDARARWLRSLDDGDESDEE